MANTKVTGDLIASLTIATGNIADNAVTSDKISGITTAHITEGSNLYYTDARARGAVSVSGNALSYNSSTGVITSNFEESPTFTGNVNTGRLFVEQSGADMIDMTRTGVGTYRLAISGSDAFSVFDVGANADRLIINSSGNVSIGQDEGGSAFNGNSVLQLSPISSGNPVYIGLKSDVSNNCGILMGDTGDSYVGGMIYNNPNNYLTINTNNAERMRITSSGNVGIGETSPDRKLHVNSGSTNEVAKFESTDSTAYLSIVDNSTTYSLQGIGSVGNNLTFYSNNAERMRIDSSGNVGIGTTPKAWTTAGGTKALQISTRTALWEAYNGTYLSNNIYYDGDEKYIESDEAAQISLGGDGTIYFQNAVSGTAGAALSWNERMRIDRTGKVGIGTTDPQRILHTSGNLVRFDNAGTSAILLLDTTNNEGYRIVTNKDNGAFSIEDMGTATSGAGTERMRIDSSGNVGINETSPASSRFTNSNSRILDISGNASNRGGLITLRTSDNSKEAFLANDAGLLQIGMYTSNDITFYTNNTERMRISSDGYLNAGAYNASSNTHHKIVTTRTNSETLRVENNSASPYGQIIQYKGAAPNTTDNWFLVCEDQSFSRLIIWSNGNVVNRNNSYGGYSDVKLKENIVDATPKLDDLMKVKVRNYNLIGDDKKQLGVVAQELEDVFPNMIDESIDFEDKEITDEEGNVSIEKIDLGTTTKSVKYSVFVPMLLKGMQEQQEIINDLKNRIETLENN